MFYVLFQNPAPGSPKSAKYKKKREEEERKKREEGKILSVDRHVHE
jgi:hypothetical protein